MPRPWLEAEIVSPTSHSAKVLGQLADFGFWTAAVAIAAGLAPGATVVRLTGPMPLSSEWVRAVCSALWAYARQWVGWGRYRPPGT